MTAADKPTDMRTCVRCGGQFWDDGNTFCPDCDVATVAPGEPDVQERVRELRQRTQAEAQAKAGTKT